VDQTAPILAALVPASGVTVRNLTQVEVTFSEPVVGIEAGDLLVNGAPASSLSVIAAGRYLFSFAQPADGLVQLAWHASHGIRDFANNPFVGSSWTYTLDPDFGVANIRINEFVAANLSGLTDEDVPAEPQDWIEIWNYGSTTVNLNGYALTDDPDDPGKWTFPSTNLAPGQFLVVFASGKDRKAPTGANRFHTNFELNPNGEYLALFNAELPRVIISETSPAFPEQRNNYSYGYDNTNGLKYFATPTPGAANGASAIAGILAPPHFNVERGMFETPFTLIISAPEPGAAIHYTKDGTEPVAGATNTLTYSGPLTITNVTVLRAAAFKSGKLPSTTVTHTYLFLDQVVQQPNRPAGFPTNWGSRMRRKSSISPTTSCSRMSYSKPSRGRCAVPMGMRSAPIACATRSLRRVLPTGWSTASGRASRSTLPRRKVRRSGRSSPLSSWRSGCSTSASCGTR
jgi:hypothetical protein